MLYLPGAPRVAEFFAGIGLVRMALEREGCRVVFANDISLEKQHLYVANFDGSHYVLDDIRRIRGDDVPDVDIAIASFPCTDLSLAGTRAGLHGLESGTFWEFARVLEEMGQRRPPAILLENVTGLSISAGGEDLRRALIRLNDLGYWCDVLLVDAPWFVPQSRPRLFIVGSRNSIPQAEITSFTSSFLAIPPSQLRPAWLIRFLERLSGVRMQALPLDPPLPTTATLADVVDRFSVDDELWWDQERLDAFTASLSPLNARRLELLREHTRQTWATAYRRTRGGRALWEIRSDSISGCLRTARGGSSKQAVVQVGQGQIQVRWMTPREYARLQGAPDYHFGEARPLQVMFGFGDAVCVPAIAWIAREYLLPLVRGHIPNGAETCVAALA